MLRFVIPVFAILAWSSGSSFGQQEDAGKEMTVDAEFLSGVGQSVLTR